MRKLIDKKNKKLVDKKCVFCDEKEYCKLDVHRIIPGGPYSQENTVVACVGCHRMIHADKIIIDKKYMSSQGTVLHYFINNEEFYVKV